DLKADGLSSPVIDLSDLSNVYGSIVMPDVVTQNLDGNGNQFNIDQVKNLADNDVPLANLRYAGKGGRVGNAASGISASGDAAIDQSAFNQTITQGANIQFNSITMNVAGDDFS